MQVNYTNNTEKFQIVGNAKVVVSSHDTEQDARQVYSATNYSEFDFGFAEVVAPGQTIERRLSDPMTQEQLDRLEAIPEGDIFGFGIDEAAK